MLLKVRTSFYGAELAPEIAEAIKEIWEEQGYHSAKAYADQDGDVFAEAPKSANWEAVKSRVEDFDVNAVFEEEDQFAISWGTNPLNTSIETARNEQDAIDALIDRLEAKNDASVIDSAKAAKEYYCDTYIIGGNHGLALIHDGLLNIEKY